MDLVNGYIPDTSGGSGAYQRPGSVLMNSSNQLGGSNHLGQGIYSAAFSGVDYNWSVVSGKLYRVSADLVTYTDVTPAGITIDGNLSTTRVFMLEFAGSLIVSDGVNRPWIGSSLSSTPIVGTPIQYDSGNSQWSAQHMTLYSGALVFVLKTIGAAWHQTRIAWSAPFDPTQGYFNTVNGIAVDYTWDLVQTSSTPIYALFGANIGLIYFRDFSIGGLTGAIGDDFRNSATHDAIDFKIGTRSPASLASVGNNLFFADTLGRPQMLPLGNRLDAIWLDMRNIVENSRTDTPAATALTAVGTIIPTMSLYVVAIWSPSPTITLAPNTAYAFDVLTGQYEGRWQFGPGINIETLGILKDQNGEPELVVIGTKVAAINSGFGGYVWRLTNPQENIWTDNGQVPLILAQSQRMGFAADRVSYADKLVAITRSSAPCTLAMLSDSTLAQGFVIDTLAVEGLLDTLITESGDTLAAESLAQATATPSPASLDGTFRVVWGPDIQGRGFLCSVSPTTATSQWGLYKLALTSVSSDAPVEEP